MGAFMQPFFARSKDEARRSFSDAVADPKMEFGKHPGDYGLYCLGEWDDAGDIVVFHDKERLMDALDVMPST
uniref:DNA binding protein VP5 n=1 Tax=Gokushovirinae environmental samples TaxID=1478972 RepID=A0A2R3UAH7_9VIRU|nr:DNA binding protein VP5 [Gokushovirinae environmental samples]